MRSRKPFLTGAAFSLRRILSPQKVKNIVTLLPMAAAPFAMIKAAIARSRSLLNTTIVRLLLPRACGAAGLSSSADSVSACGPLRTHARIMRPSSLADIRVLPVLLHQAAMSILKPGSLAVISMVAPSGRFFIAADSFIIGPGHCSPHASITSTAEPLGHAAIAAAGFCAGWGCGLSCMFAPARSVLSCLYIENPPLRLSTVNPSCISRRAAK